MPLAQIFDLKKDLRFQQGIEQGIELGEHKKLREIIELWISEGKLSDDTMANLLNVSLDFVHKIRTEFGAKKNETPKIK